MDKGMDGWAEQEREEDPQGDRMKTRSESCHRIQGSQRVRWPGKIK